MRKQHKTRSIQTGLLTLIALGTFLLVVGVGTANNLFTVYLPIVNNNPTPTPSSETTCSNPASPIPIPEQTLQDVTDTIQISENKTISDLDVPLDISHSYVGDLVISLQHIETNTTVTLIDRAGYNPNPLGCKRPDIQAILNDEASIFAEDMCNSHPPAISGEVAPEEPLSSFDGQSTSGNWRLIISDHIELDGGSLNNWCLTFR